MTVRVTLKATTTAIALAFCAAPMAAITAQGAAAQSARSYSSEELDIFTNALVQVAEVRQKYTPIMERAETEDQRAAVIQEANVEIVDVIEQTDGMTVEKYTEIAEAASADQSLNQRIMKRVQADSGETQ